MLDRLRTASPGGLLGVLAALLVAGVIFTIIVDDDQDPQTGKRHRTITVRLGGPGEKQITLPPAAQEVATTQAVEDAQGADVAAESDLHDNTPPAPADQAAAEKLQPPGQPDIPATVPLAAPHNAGCTTALVRNQSSRNGSPVLLGMIHWTGSRNLAGTADGLGIVRWFDNPAAQASSHYITDDEGHCWLTVAESQKAWTQAGFNPWSVSVEIINQGVQPLFAAAAGRARVVKLMRGWHRRWKIPYRRGAITGCRVTRSGFLAHRDLGACGGGHPDVGTFDLNGLIREAKTGDAARKTATRRRVHATTHRRLRELGCADPVRRARHPAACRGLYAENRRLHRAGL